uniref:Uncharacterized protein n=1 Tax=Solanum tuberosum TaxID=4113 RepID=M1CWW3_SOLTU
MHSDNCDDDKDVDGIMPKLQRADYYTVLPMEELLSKEKEEVHTDGFCSWDIHGGSSGSDTFAIQMAKCLGVKVSSQQEVRKNLLHAKNSGPMSNLVKLDM